MAIRLLLKRSRIRRNVALSGELPVDGFQRWRPCNLALLQEDSIMRALWLVPAALALLSAAIDADCAPVYARSAPAAHVSRSGPVSGPGNWSRGSNVHMSPNWQGSAHRYPRPRFRYAVPYVLPYYVQPGYADAGYEDSGYGDSGYDGSDGNAGYAQAQYEQPQDDVPAAPAVVPAIQAAVAYVVQYVTSGQPQPVNVPADARVTKGTLYKYTHNGVNTYTNMPPPNDVGAKTLFQYTEVDTPLAGQNLYRCVDGKSQQVNYSSRPVASLYCKAVGSGAPAAN